LASYLQKNRIQAQIFDANYHSWSEERTVKKIIKFQPDLVGISAMTHEIKVANHLAGQIKKKLKKIPVVIGGCHLTALPRETLEEFSNFDFGIYGEGEKPLFQLVRILERDPKTEGFKKVESLVYRTKKGKIRVNPPAERLTSKELDQLPYPAFDQYYQTSETGTDRRYPIMASRGCPFNCAFCMQVLGRQVRRRLPGNLLREVEMAVKKFGVKTFAFYDEIFIFNDQASVKTLKLMKKHQFAKKLRWCANSRANLITKDLAKLAKQAGCYSLEFGVESGSEEILKKINKQITLKQVEKAIGEIKASGIKTFAYFILGHPGETRKTIRATIDFAVKLNPDQIAVGLMVPYPGTEIYRMAQKGEGGYRLLSRDWSKYDKYGGGALELKGLPLAELERWQRQMFLEFYLRNGRFLDLAKFILKYKREIFWLLRN